MPRNRRKATKCEAEHVIDQGLCVSRVGTQYREHLFDQMTISHEK